MIVIQRGCYGISIYSYVVSRIGSFLPLISLVGASDWGKHVGRSMGE
jgi:hypothetical protein